MSFNALKFLRDFFDTPDGVVNLIAKHMPDSVPEREAVVKWFSRKSIPSNWLPVLLVVISDAAGGYPDLRPYIERAGDYDIFQ